MMTVRAVFPKIGDGTVISKFGPNGIPMSVRFSLRAVIPGLTKKLGDRVEANLNAGLKSRRRLVVKKEMVEDTNTKIIGRVTTVSTSEPYMLPAWLEDGTKAHDIVARNAPVLSFFWARIGRQAFFPRVHHPGFAGIHYTQAAFAAMEDEIQRVIKRAVRDGVGAK